MHQRTSPQTRSCHTEHRDCTLSKFPMPASTKSHFITARFAFFSFPLSKFLCLLGLLQRDLHFLIFRCQNSSACPVFNSGIYIFLFSAVSSILLARFSTAGFAISYFPLLQTFFLPDFQRRDLHFSVFRCSQNFTKRDDLNNLRFLKQPSPDNPEVVCLFPFPYRKATNTESSFVFVAFSYPSPSKIQRKLMLSSFLLLFLTISYQKYNEN